MRQAGTWDIWLQCLHSEQISPLARKHKGNYKVLKITACISSWEQIMDKIQKDQKKKKNPTATSNELGGKTRCQEQKHHTVYALPAALNST